MAEEYDIAFKHKHIIKTHLHVKRLTWNIYWMLAEKLKHPKRSRNPWHNWVEQKKKREKKKESEWD